MQKSTTKGGAKGAGAKGAGTKAGKGGKGGKAKQPSPLANPAEAFDALEGIDRRTTQTSFSSRSASPLTDGLRSEGASPVPSPPRTTSTQAVHTSPAKQSPRQAKRSRISARDAEAPSDADTGAGASFAEMDGPPSVDSLSFAPGLGLSPALSGLSGMRMRRTLSGLVESLDVHICETSTDLITIDCPGLSPALGPSAMSGPPPLEFAV